MERKNPITVKFDKANNVTFAIGNYKGNKIKAVSICHSGDTFDEDFGAKLCISKWHTKTLLKDLKVLNQAEKEANDFLAKVNAAQAKVQKKLENRHAKTKAILVNKYGE